MSYKIEVRKSIYSLVGRVPKTDIVNLFIGNNISRATIYRTIRECEEGIPCLNLPKSGRPRIMSNNNVNRLLQSVKERIGASTRKLARRFGVGRMTICREIRRHNLKFRKRRKCPKYSNLQLQRIPRCCRALRLQHFVNDKVIIMDDEKYFTLANAEIKGNDGFYTDNFHNAPDNVKFKAKAKFSDKVLVWCAISSAGVSQPFVGHVRGEAVTAELYTRRCLPKLLHFINRHHNNEDIMFWPDLASCHYARMTRDWLEANHIPFVPKDDNPPNVPQARPIEEFWALLSRKVYNNGWEATDEEHLRRRIRQKIREIDVGTIQRLMLHVRRKLRQIEDHGPLAAI